MAFCVPVASMVMTGHSEALIAPVQNAGVVNLFFDQFSKSLLTDVHAALIWDGAGDHTAKAIRCPANVTPIQLPPYSPELSPVGNLWHHLRSHHWSNRTYEGVDALYDEAEDEWRRCCLDPATVKSVCHAPTSPAQSSVEMRIIDSSSEATAVCRPPRC